MSVMAKKKSGRRPSRPDVAPPVKELMDAGWSRQDAEHLVVVEFALSVIDDLGADIAPALESLAGNVGIALQWEPVLCGAYALYTESEHAASWRALAGAAEGPMRDVMLRLAAYADNMDIETGSPADLITADDLRIVEEARQAESRGELEEAVRLLRTCRRPLDDAWRRDLEHLVRAGDDVSPAIWGRWICSAALRWCQTSMRGVEMGEHYAVVALRALGASEEIVREQAYKRALYDQVVHDALLWDEGGLAEYIERELAPALAARVPGLATWPDAPLRVLHLLGERAGDAMCEDVHTGEPIVVGDDRLALQHPRGRLFVGRLVHVDGDSRAYFAMKPTMCEDVGTAVAVAAAEADGCEPERRIDLLHQSLAADAA